MIKQAAEILNTPRKDGDIEAVVIRIQDTGLTDVPYQVTHNLGRVPVGCVVQLCNKECSVYKGSVWNKQVIEVKFTAANADINLRIW